uniref:Uncharacterized protein n=1 Tax=Onchocerca volvulus TaxID=6282 RepID=A0A8R1XTS3_ONCVO
MCEEERVVHKRNNTISILNQYISDLMISKQLLNKLATLFNCCSTNVSSDIIMAGVTKKISEIGIGSINFRMKIKMELNQWILFLRSSSKWVKKRNRNSDGSRMMPDDQQNLCILK